MATDKKIIVNGEVVSPEDIGADYVLAHGGAVPAGEVIDASTIAADVRERNGFVAKQELVTLTSSKASPSDIVDSVLKEIAEELAHIKYERQKAAREGKSTLAYTTSRINSLKTLADVLGKKIEANAGKQIDLRHPQFKEIIRLWMEFVYESMQKAHVSDDMIDIVFKQIQADMIDWERRVLEL